MESSRSTTIRETRTYESSNATGSSGGGPAKHIIITRTQAGPRVKSTQMERSSKANFYQAGGPMANYTEITTTGVNSVMETRDREKKDMQDLNERFANYIDRVRNLEAQNRKLSDDLDKLKTKWGKETEQIKAMFQAELDEARKDLDEAEREKARLEIRVAGLEEQIDEVRLELSMYVKLAADYNERLARQNQQLIDYEHEIQLLRRRIEQLENDRDKDKKLIEALTEALAKAREDLDVETLAHIDAENRCQTLQEEIDFLKQIHGQEMQELSCLVYRDTEPENRDYWKNEMAQAIREIQQMYDDKMDTMRGDLETHYKSKVEQVQHEKTKQNMGEVQVKQDLTDCKQELTDLKGKLNDLGNQNTLLMRELEMLRRQKEERERELDLRNAELQSECARIKAELDAILRQLNSVMETKLGLELEIAAYRKLLEGEENRLNLKSTMESMSAGGGGGGYSHGSGGSAFDREMGSTAKGEISAKTTFQKSAKGPVAISECPPDGKFIQIENTGTKDENLVGWKILRTVDKKDMPAFELDSRFSSVRSRQKITCWAKGQKPRSAPSQDIEVNFDSWGIGAMATTRLINKEGEERASNVQKTSYSS